MLVIISVTACQNTPKLNSINQQSFYYAHRFYGSWIWTGNGGDRLSLFCDVWGVSWEDLESGMTHCLGVGIILNFLHWHVWCQGWGDSKTEISWDCCCGYSGWLDLPTLHQPDSKRTITFKGRGHTVHLLMGRVSKNSVPSCKTALMI